MYGSNLLKGKKCGRSDVGEDRDRLSVGQVEVPVEIEVKSLVGN